MTNADGIRLPGLTLSASEQPGLGGLRLGWPASIECQLSSPKALQQLGDDGSRDAANVGRSVFDASGSDRLYQAGEKSLGGVAQLVRAGDS